MKINIAWSFKNASIDLADTLKLDIYHNSCYYIDKSMAYGAIHGTAIFQRISDAIRNILTTEGISV